MARRKRKQSMPIATVPAIHFRGIGHALLLTVAVVIVLATLLSVTGMTEVIARWLAIFGAVISVLWGSFYTCRHLGRDGWLNGGIVGGGYALILLLLAILLDMGFSWYGLLSLAAAFVLGAVGGVMGTNSR